MSESSPDLLHLQNSTGDGSTPEAGRREFLKTAACATLGVCAVAAPVAFGTVVFVNPLVTKHSTGIRVRMADLDDLVVGGAPKLYQVIAEPVDAWTKFPRKAVGAIFLQRTGDREVRAFNALCPHVGGPVTFREESGDFYCPLHSSRFTVDGALTSQDTPSPRGMDSLDIDLEGGEIWVHFRNFAPNTKDKIPV